MHESALERGTQGLNRCGSSLAPVKINSWCIKKMNTGDIRHGKAMEWGSDKLS